MDATLFNNLLTAVEETSGSSRKQLRDDPNFLTQTTSQETKEDLVHTGLTDSSDDEDNRNFEVTKYNEFGRSVKHLLEEEGSTSSPSSSPSPKTVSSKWTSKPQLLLDKSNESKQLQVPQKSQATQEHYTDPIFGIRIKNPLISSLTLKDRMQGRLAIPMIKLRKFVESIPPNTDWVITGVIVQKTGRTSQKGNQFSIWTLSDLHGDLKTMSLFLFRSAHKDLWKCSIGTVVGVLNPSVFEKKQGSKDEACLSVDNVQKVMILGQSKDFGTCKSIKKDGSVCTAFVNISRCEYCIYHIKQEYQKCSKRSEIQSSFSGGGLNALRNKVLGKNEVFYAGKSYTAIKPLKSRKLQAQDRGRLDLLSGINIKSNNISKAKSSTGQGLKKKMVEHVEMSVNRRLKDFALLKKLGGKTENCMKKTDDNATSLAKSSEVTLKESKNSALSVIAKLKAKSSVPTKSIELENANCDMENENNLSDIDFGLSDDECETSPSKAETTKTISSLTTPEDEKKKDVSISTNNPKLETKILTTTTITATPSCSGIKSKIDFPKAHCSAVSLSTNNPKVETKILATTTTPAIPSCSGIKSKIDNITKAHCSTVPESSKLSKKSTISKKADVPSLGVGFDIPILSGIGNKLVDLSSPITKSHINRANQNALKWVQRNGPIQKENPNKTSNKGGSKRPLNVEEKSDPKRQKILENEHFSQRFKKMMAATSSHADLLVDYDNLEVDKYFDKLEMKEKMEEKMTSTYKVQCKAVQCLQCKYTSFSAADRCKKEKHPLKVFDATKRFFMCGDCGNRTVSLNVIPTESCKKCGSGKWERTGMMKEKIVVPKSELSIRGGEQTFVNSNISNTNINLLMPDD